MFLLAQRYFQTHLFLSFIAKKEDIPAFSKLYLLKIKFFYFIVSTISFIVSMDTRPFKVYLTPSETNTAIFSDTTSLSAVSFPLVSWI